MTEQNRHPLERFAQASRDTGIRRPKRGRWVAGVAGGIAARYQIDPAIVRVAFIIAAFFGGFGLTVYLFAWALLPAEDGSVAVERGLRQGDAGSIVLCVFALLSLSGLGSSGSGGASVIWVVVALGIAAWMLNRQRNARAGGPGHDVAGAPEASGITPGVDSRADKVLPGAPNASTPAPFRRTSHPRGYDTAPDAPYPSPQPPWPLVPTPSDTSTAAPAATPSAPRRRIGVLVTMFAVGAAIIAYLGTTWVIYAVGAAGDPHTFGLIAVLVVCGLTLIGVGLSGHSAPLVTIAAWLLGITLAFSTLPGVQLNGLHVTSGSIGERNWAPTTAQELQAPFDLTVGDGTLDLTRLPASEARKAEAARLGQGIGSLTLIVPSAYGTRVNVDTGIGQVSVERDGRRSVVQSGPSESSESDRALTFGSGPSALTIDVDQGIGDLIIVEKDAP